MSFWLFEWLKHSESITFCVLKISDPSHGGHRKFRDRNFASTPFNFRCRFINRFHLNGTYKSFNPITAKWKQSFNESSVYSRFIPSVCGDVF